MPKVQEKLYATKALDIKLETACPEIWKAEYRGDIQEHWIVSLYKASSYVQTLIIDGSP